MLATIINAIHCLKKLLLLLHAHHHTNWCAVLCCAIVHFFHAHTLHAFLILCHIYHVSTFSCSSNVTYIINRLREVKGKETGREGEWETPSATHFYTVAPIFFPQKSAMQNSCRLMMSGCFFYLLKNMLIVSCSFLFKHIGNTKWINTYTQTHTHLYI